MFTEKQRLENAFSGLKNDRPPCICPGGMMNMAVRELMEFSGAFFPDAHTDPDVMANLAKSAYDAKCFENFGVPFCMTIEAEEMGAKVDLGNMMYEPHVKEYAINSADEWEKLTDLNLDSGRCRVVLDAIKILKKDNGNVPVIGNIPGPVSVASSVIEPADCYKGFSRKNDNSHKMMLFVTNQLIKFAKAQIAAGADVITISDPSGTGEILAPRLFDEFTIQYVNLLIEELKADYPDTPVIVHICGRMHKVYGLIQKLKCDAFSFDSFVNLKDARRHLPNHVIMGNVSTYTIEYGHPDKVYDITAAAIRNGTNIVAPACGLGNGSPLGNLQAMLKATVRG